MHSIQRILLRNALLADLREAWQKLLARHPDEHFYGFGLYTTDVASYLMATAFTHEGLAQVTGRYVEKYGGAPELQRAMLRWSPCDSPLHTIDGGLLLPRAQAVRGKWPDPYEGSPESESATRTVFEVAVEVLRQLDEQGTFGDTTSRGELVLGIWKGDQSDEERVSFVRLLNPRSVANRFAQELKDGEQAVCEWYTSRRT